MAVAFVRVLRAAGVEVSVGATLTFAEALGCVGLVSREGVYWAGRATVVNRPEDIAMFDRAFAVFWDQRSGGPDEVELPPEEVIIALDIPGADEPPPGDDEVGADAPVVTLRWSAREVLRHRDFALYTPAEFVEARRLMSDLRLLGAVRPVAAPQAVALAPRDTGSAPDRPPVHAGGRRTGRARVRRPGGAHPPARPAPRRQRIDGAVRACVRAVLARRRDRSLAGRGLRAREPVSRASRAS